MYTTNYFKLLRLKFNLTNITLTVYVQKTIIATKQMKQYTMNYIGTQIL